MKRILTVLALLAVCGMAFSVTGKSYVRFNPTWDPNDSGFDVAFDSFGFTYHFNTSGGAPDLPVATNFPGATGGDALAALNTIANGTTLAATGPGYFQITGLKLGDNAVLNVDALWYTINYSASSGMTNGTVSSATTAGYNFFKTTPKLVITLDDKTTITSDWGDVATPIEFWGGSATFNNASTTNAGSGGGYLLGVPAKFDYNGIDKLAIEIYPYIQLAGNNTSGNVGSTTNSYSYSAFKFSVYGQGIYTLNETMGVLGRVTVQAQTSAEHQVLGTATNDYASAKTPLQLYGEFKWHPAGPVNMNFGIGDQILLTQTATKTGSVSGTNAVTTSAPGLLGADGGVDPFVYLNGSTKFAEDWTLGITVKAYFAPASTGTSTLVNGAPSSWATSSNPLVFANQINDDATDNGKSIYIQYAKDAATIRFAIGGAGQGVFNAVESDISYTF